MMRTMMIAGLLASLCLGQQQEEPKPQRYYRLEYVVKELDNDKVINSRRYATTVALGMSSPAAIRSGSRFPFTTESGGSKSVNYYDIGVNIDSRDARELPVEQLIVHVNADITSLVVGKEPAAETPPIVRRTSWISPAVVPLKKPTTIFSSDDPTGNRKMQLELTATPIN